MSNIQKTMAVRYRETITGTPFNTPEEVWFWYYQCQALRDLGVRGDTTSTLVRPCDIDDVYRIVLQLTLAGRLSRDMLGVMQKYGALSHPPLSTLLEEQRDYELWKYAMDIFGEVLVRKGIMTPPRSQEGANEEH